MDQEQEARNAFQHAMNAYRKGDLETARVRTEQARALWTALHGPACIPVSTCLNNLGRIFEEKGDMAQGIAFHRQASDMRRSLLGNHLETAFSLGNLGTALAADAQWREAARVLEEALAMYARSGKSSGEDIAGYQANLNVCRRALADEEKNEAGGR